MAAEGRERTPSGGFNNVWSGGGAQGWKTQQGSAGPPGGGGVEAHGKRLHAGTVERETTVVGTVRFVQRFAVLYSDPFLGLFTDESAAESKGSRSLAGCTATQDGKVVEIAVPNDKPLKLRTTTVEEAQVLFSLQTTPLPLNLTCTVSPARRGPPSSIWSARQQRQSHRRKATLEPGCSTPRRPKTSARSCSQYPSTPTRVVTNVVVCVLWLAG